MTQQFDKDPPTATVLVTGGLREGVTAEAARAALRDALGLAEQQAAALCSGRPRRVKSALPMSQARALAVRLHRCGVLARVEPDEAPPPPAAPQPATSEPAADASATPDRVDPGQAAAEVDDDVSVVPGIARTLQAEAPPPAASSPPAASAPRRRTLLALAACALIGVVGVTLWSMRDTARPPAPPQVAEPAPAVPGGWSLQTRTSDGEALCVLHSPVLDGSGNTFIVSSADGGKLWVPALFFSRPSALINDAGSIVSFGVDGRPIARARLQRTEAGPAFANLNADPMAGYALLYAMAEGQRLTLDGDALTTPVQLDLADFRRRAAAFQGCLEDGDFFDYRVHADLSARNAAWAFSMEQFVTSLVMLETTAPAGPR